MIWLKKTKREAKCQQEWKIKSAVENIMEECKGGLKGKITFEGKNDGQW